MHIIADPKKSNQRLDKFLVDFALGKKEFENFSRGDFIRAIKDGFVKVNGEISRPSYKVNSVDNIEINIPEKSEKIISNPKIKLDVIFENDNFLIINKPAGIQIHPDFNEKENTIVNGLIAHYPQIAKLESNEIFSFQQRPGIVHRLDKETSGVLIIAKNKKTFLEFKKMFQEKTVHKKYLALVHGVPKEKESIIEKPLARTTNYRKQTIAGKKTKTKIRPAITHYKVLEKFKNNFSLIEASPKTGRTHQIRVHLSSIGHPIIGDKLYSKKIYQPFEKASRHMLHAHEIEFNLFGEKFHFTAPIPNDFQKIIKEIKNA